MNHFIKNTAAACGLILAVSACSPTKTAEDFALTSQTLIQENKYEEAVIQLKNGIRNYNKNAELRELLGEIYLAQGNAAFAEKEIQKALQFGSENQSLFPMLLKSLHLQGKYAEIIETFKSQPRLNNEERAQSLLYVALAEHAEGDPEAAVAFIEEANEVTEDSAYSHLGSAFAKAYEKNHDESLALIDEVISQNANIAEAYMLKGQLFAFKKDYPNAIKTYEKYIELLPKDPKGKFLLTNVLISNHEFSKAETYIDELLARFPNSAIINQFKGLVEYDKKSFEGAKRHLEKAIQGDRNIPSNNLFAGISNYQLKNFEQAYSQLSLVAKHFPEDHIAWRYLASTQLALGYSEDISDTMENISYNSELDSALFLKASENLIQSGKKDEAYELLLKGNILDTNEPMLIAKQGLLKVQSGHMEGIEEIEKSLMLSPHSNEIQTLLARTYLSNGFADKALSLAEEMIESEPENVEGYNLAGLAYIQKKELDSAKPYFDKAKELLPSNALTYIYYSTLAESTEDYKLSINYIEQLLEEHPKYAKALYKYYVLQKKYGDVNIALEKLSAVAKQYSSELSYPLLYASVLVKENRAQDVITLLEPLKSQNDLPTPFWEMLGDSYIQTGQIKNALNAFEQWDEKESSLKSKVKLAMGLSAAKEFDRSYAILEEVAKEHGSAHLLSLRANVALQAKKFDASLQLVKEHEKLTPNQELSVPMVGIKIKALIGKGLYQEAKVYSDSVYLKSPTEELAQYVVITYIKLGQNGEAINFLESHLKSFTADTDNRFKLATLYFKTQPTKAIEQYKVILETKPNNFIVLNNLAWLSMENNELDAAYSYIQQAVAIAPNNEDVKDTFNTIELKRNSQ